MQVTFLSHTTIFTKVIRQKEGAKNYYIKLKLNVLMTRKSLDEIHSHFPQLHRTEASKVGRAENKGLTHASILHGLTERCTISKYN
jgi:hypothetical protein